MTHDMSFHDSEHKFEKSFWGNCANTYGEETKQMVYADLMGLKFSNYWIDVSGKKILDIGGGPTSLLLKSWNFADAMVVDPIMYPDWIYGRYVAHGVDSVHMNGEDVSMTGFDEVWIYNVMQHCVDPKKIIANAKRAAPVLRIFEWIDFPPHPGHPQMLTEDALNKWTGKQGRIVHLNENGCYGRSYSGYFSWV